MINGFCYLFTVAFFTCAVLFTAYCAMIYFYVEKDLRQEMSFRNFVCFELTETLSFLLMAPEIKEKPITKKRNKTSTFEKILRRMRGARAEVISFENHKNKNRG